MKREICNLKQLFEPDWRHSNVAVREITCGNCGQITNRNESRHEQETLERGKFEIELHTYYCSGCDNWLCADEIAIVPEAEESEESDDR